MNSFQPQMDIRSEAQQAIWPDLAGAECLGLTLYDGIDTLRIFLFPLDI